MPRHRPAAAAAATAATLAAALVVAAGAARAETIRVAQFNAAMNRAEAGALRADLAAGDDPQIRAVAEIIQRVRPDVLLVNEFDHQPGNAALFARNYLGVAQDVSGVGGAQAIDYAEVFEAPSNTGMPSGLDLDGDGALGGPGDAHGFGFFPGQFGMAVFSRLPIDRDAVRTFQTLRLADVPGARVPVDPGTGEPFLDEAALEAFRLPSKSLWDVPIKVGGETIHLIASHPTPPVFDGPEDRNGLRNADEIRLLADYVAGEDYFVDDEGVAGGLAPGASFVIAGDLNADPFDGASTDDAVLQVLDSLLVRDPMPASEGGADAAARQGGANEGQAGDPRLDTADFNDAEGAAGNLRVDYVLPSADLDVAGAGVFWPEADDPLFPLVGDFPFASSDHRLVFVDLEVAPAPIPVPGSLPLLAGGLALLPRRRRRGA